jgi:hypothetical protein
MLTNVTVSAENTLIKKAKEKAHKENKTLNSLFNEWLSRYIRDSNPADEYEEFMARAKYANPGKKFSREEMNAR